MISSLYYSLKFANGTYTLQIMRYSIKTQTLYLQQLHILNRKSHKIGYPLQVVLIQPVRIPFYYHTESANTMFRCMFFLREIYMKTYNYA